MARTTRTSLGPVFSEGARRSWLALADRGWTVADLRKRLLGRRGRPLASGVVDGWIYGDVYPSVPNAKQMYDVLGVPVDAWALPPSEPFVLPAAKRAEAA